MEEGWISCDKKLPPFFAIVQTKIEDEQGTRNIRKLKRVPDRISAYAWLCIEDFVKIHYTCKPTHWRAISDSPRCP